MVAAVRPVAFARKLTSRRPPPREARTFAAVLPGRTTGTASRRSWRIVEWTYNVRALNDDDRVEAERLLVDDSPSDQPGEAAIFHSPPVAV
jgi:hypothetical protein